VFEETANREPGAFDSAQLTATGVQATRCP
jgi:hypothetical protein